MKNDNSKKVQRFLERGTLSRSVRKSQSHPSILGLDLSLNGTGIVLFSGGTYSTEELAFQSGTDIFQKWDSIVKKVLTYADSASIILIEDYAFGAFGSSKSALYELGGIVRYNLTKNNHNYFTVPPTSLKKFATGKGNSQKSIILKEVFRRWNFDTNSDNVADAFCLVKMAEAVIFRNGTKEQESIINKIKLDTWIEEKIKKCRNAVADAGRKSEKKDSEEDTLHA